MSTPKWVRVGATYRTTMDAVPLGRAAYSAIATDNAVDLNVVPSSVRASAAWPCISPNERSRTCSSGLFGSREANGLKKQIFLIQRSPQHTALNKGTDWPAPPDRRRDASDRARKTACAAVTIRCTWGARDNVGTRGTNWPFSSAFVLGGSERRCAAQLPPRF
jgi:hypothetical protein